jgi:hypothetical protein
MAKKANSTKYEKATINVEDMTITEFLKDDTKEHNILDVLREWDNVDNITITFAKNSEV